MQHLIDDRADVLNNWLIRTTRKKAEAEKLRGETDKRVSSYEREHPGEIEEKHHELYLAAKDRWLNVYMIRDDFLEVSAFLKVLIHWSDAYLASIQKKFDTPAEDE